VPSLRAHFDMLNAALSALCVEILLFDKEQLSEFPIKFLRHADVFF
jgi:hypothetical protein